MLIETLCTDWQKLKTTNFTDTSFATVGPTAIEPTGDGVIDCVGDTGAIVQNALLAKFFGTSANNQNFNVRILGWSRWLNANGVYTWDFIILCQLAVTLGNLAGAANCIITATDFQADTIVVTYGSTLSGEAPSENIVSPANDVPGAHVLVDTKGSRKVQFQFDRNSSAASANGAVRRF